MTKKTSKKKMVSGLPPLDGKGSWVDELLKLVEKEHWEHYQDIYNDLLDGSLSSYYLQDRFASLGIEVADSTIRAWRRARLEFMVQPADTLPQLQRPVHPSPSRDIELAKNEAVVTVTAPKGESTVGKAREYLEAQGQDPDKWVVSRFQGSERELASGQVLESNRWTFVPNTDCVSSTDEPWPDLDDLHAYVQRTNDSWGRLTLPTTNEGRTAVAVLADFQLGKVDYRGSAEDTLGRVEGSLARFRDWVQDSQPEEIVLVDAGDLIEGFESTAAEDRTNDLELTEQVRLGRRIMFLWIDAAAEFGVPVKWMTVPSNHSSVRRGKNNMGTPRDDYGIEVASQLKDMCEVAPERYGHVEFYVPEKHEESLALTLVGGKTLGLIHGHQVRNPDGIPKFLEGQAAGETPIGLSDFAVVGHFHHWRSAPWGRGKLYFIAPTSDNGSSWWLNLSGQDSGAAVLGLSFTPDGWDETQLRFL